MTNERVLRIIFADRFEHCIIIGFSDGRAGRYSSTLLHNMMPQSEELFELGTPGEGDEPDAATLSHLSANDE